MTPIVISESTTEPILLAEALLNLRGYADSPEAVDGGRISKLITAARQACEQELEMSLVEKTLEISADSFGSSIILPDGPVRSIVSVKYLDTDGVDTTLAADQYRISAYVRDPVILMPAWDVSWPNIRGDVDAVRVRYIVGYPSTDSPPQTVPEPIRQAMHLLIVHYFDNRNAVDVNTLAELPLGVCSLLARYRRSLGV